MERPQKEKIVQDFAKLLRKARETRGLTQRGLALEADMEQKHIAKMEKGINNPSLTTLIALAEALKIHPGELIP